MKNHFNEIYNLYPNMKYFLFLIKNIIGIYDYTKEKEKVSCIKLLRHYCQLKPNDVYTNHNSLTYDMQIHIMLSQNHKT